jgi:glycosyltransferase involved in cell wall biosynthesis
VKVCFITTSFIRSAEDHYARFVYEQAKSLQLADGDIDVVVIAPHALGLATHEVLDGLEIHRKQYFWPSGLQCLAYQHEGLFETLRSSPIAAVQLPFLLLAMLVGLVKASKAAQIIHAQWIPTAAIAVLVGRLRRIPVVVSVRGADLNTARKSRLGRAITRAVIARVGHVVTVSDEFQTYLRSELSSSMPITAVYNGVDGQQFHPRDKAQCRRELGMDADRFLALYVGGLIARKGITDLLEALTSDVISECDLDLYIVGEGPQLAELERMSAAKGLTDRVHFVGRVPKDRIHLWMAAADVLVLPSYSEGRPNVVLEAMATGTPVLATRVAGTAELMSDGKEGLLFQPGDVAGLATGLKRLLEDPALATRLSAAGPTAIRSRGLTWQEHGRRLISIYHHLLRAR